MQLGRAACRGVCTIVLHNYNVLYVYIHVVYLLFVINHQEKNLTVIVEPAILSEELICTDEYQPIKHQLQSWKEQDLGVYHNYYIFTIVIFFFLELCVCV